ncbi:MAG: CAP domain-containing protein [Planctomycetes bacterium]|nr:CAP domain-containing protein [Planctomycetota bacterium]
MPTPSTELRTPSSSEGRVRPKPKKNFLPIVVGALAVGLLGFVVATSGGDSAQAELAIVQRARKDGQLERAAAEIAKLRQAWGDAQDDRLQRLEAEQRELDTIHGEIERLTAQVLDPAISRTHAQWILELRGLEGGENPAVAIAARRVRGSLTETLLRRPVTRVAAESAPDAPEAKAAALAEAPAAAAAAPNEAAPARIDPPAVARPDAVAAARKEATRLLDQGLFAQAIAILQEGLANGDAAAADGLSALQQHLDFARGTARAAMNALVAEANRVSATNPADAARLLVVARHRFPATPEFAPLAEALQKAEQAVREAKAAAAEQAAPLVKPAVDDAARIATVAGLRSQLDAARSAEERGDFGAAAVVLREAAAAARDRDPDFAGRLEGRAVDAELIAAWHQAIANVLQGGRTLKCTTAAGRAVTLQSTQGSELVGTSADGTVHITWVEVSALGIAMLGDQAQVRGEAALGAATLLYKNTDRERAEALLAKTLQADAALKAIIDGVLSRGRGEPVDSRGYTLGKEGFVSARSVELQKEGQKLAARLDTALADRDPAARDKVLAEVAASGPDAVAVLTTALKKQFDQRIAKVDGSGLKKQLDRLAEQRRLLDAARQEAKALIYDEVKYFYPYRPPAVSADKFAEYNRVQAEVNRLVTAVRVIWKDERIKVRVPASMHGDLDRIDWLARNLSSLGALDPAAMAKIGWARALPAGDAVSIRDYCVDASERAEIEEWRRVEAFNAIAGKQVGSSARELLAITNEYRAMFRHRPLAVVRVVCNAAQGHAEEMTKLGYFSHMSPTPGRTTPYDRMRLAGYNAGVSENIALHDGALGAHNAWCTSSGHHRNLLDPSHTEMGIGCDGRNWVENFGAGSVYRDDPAWAAAGEAASR